MWRIDGAMVKKAGDSSPMQQTYDWRCSCCYLGISHSQTFHDTEVQDAKARGQAVEWQSQQDIDWS